jgi:hypothetical protein
MAPCCLLQEGRKINGGRKSVCSQRAFDVLLQLGHNVINFALQMKTTNEEYQELLLCWGGGSRVSAFKLLKE